MTEWHYAVRSIREHVVKIELPDSYGSGFFIARRQVGRAGQVVVATANHVIEHADRWAELIRINHLATLTSVELAPDQREVLTKPERDLALVIFDEAHIQFPDNALPLETLKNPLPPGAPVGWCGFPNMVSDHLCFYAGHVSTQYYEAGDYLLDGVAINGVSGGPVFIHRDRNTSLVGLISAYVPNLATGETLPGMSLMSSVKPFLEHFRTGKAQQL